jgi:hypothetical protein
MIGEAKLDEWRVDEPREMFAAYGNLGVFTLEDLETTARGAQGLEQGKVLGLKFDWYREFAEPMFLRNVKMIIPTYNPITARSITYAEALEFRRRAGWNVTELSFR